MNDCDAISPTGGKVVGASETSLRCLTGRCDNFATQGFHFFIYI